MAIPKPNYDAQKPEDVFVFDESLLFENEFIQCLIFFE
jgi:hypothetical protein